MKILKQKNYLINGFIFLILAIIMLIWSVFIDNSIINNNKTLHDIIRNSSNRENEIVSLTVTEKPYAFAEYDTNVKSPKYYFLLDNDYMYIGYLDYKTYKKLNVDNVKDNPIKINGMTKKIPSDVVKIAIETYNKEKKEEFLTEENYNSYIGSVCIDTVNIVNNKRQITLGIISIIISITSFWIYIKKEKKDKEGYLWQEKI